MVKKSKIPLGSSDARKVLKHGAGVWSINKKELPNDC